MPATPWPNAASGSGSPPAPGTVRGGAVSSGLAREAAGIGSTEHAPRLSDSWMRDAGTPKWQRPSASAPRPSAITPVAWASHLISGSPSESIGLPCRRRRGHIRAGMRSPIRVPQRVLAQGGPARRHQAALSPDPPGRSTRSGTLNEPGASQAAVDRGGIEAGPLRRMRDWRLARHATQPARAPQERRWHRQSPREPPVPLPELPFADRHLRRAERASPSGAAPRARRAAARGGFGGANRDLRLARTARARSGFALAFLLPSPA